MCVCGCSCIDIYLSIYLSILFTNPSARAGYDTRSIFKRSLTGFNSEFSFSETSCLTKAEEPRLSYYLPIAGRRIIGFIRFPRVLVLCEMQWVSSRIWTRVAVFISYDENNYTTGTYLPIYLSIFVLMCVQVPLYVCMYVCMYVSIYLSMQILIGSHIWPDIYLSIYLSGYKYINRWQINIMFHR